MIDNYESDKDTFSDSLSPGVFNNIKDIDSDGVIDKAELDD